MCESIYHVSISISIFFFSLSLSLFLSLYLFIYLSCVKIAGEYSLSNLYTLVVFFSFFSLACAVNVSINQNEMK